MSDFESFLGDLNSDLFEEVPESSVRTAEPEPDVFETADELPIGDGQCVICGAPTFRPPGLTKGGYRHRAPKYCDIHKTSPTRKADGDIGTPAFNLTGELKRIQDELTDELALFGMATGPILPTTGYFIVENAEDFTGALIELIRNKPRLLNVARRLAQISPAYKGLKYVAGAAIAVQVDQKKIDPHNHICASLGVERAYDAVHPQGSGQPNMNGSSPGFPQYATLQ